MTGQPWQTELAPITSPMFQLYIFFMITDPKTTVRTKRGQMETVVVVAAVEAAMRLMQFVHAPYYALFIVGPAANLIEIASDRKKRGRRRGRAHRQSPIRSRRLGGVDMSDATAANQKTIIANEKGIVSNQKAILANQKAIQANQKTIQKNQGTLLANQKTILGNQKKILAGSRATPSSSSRRREAHAAAPSTSTLAVITGAACITTP